MTVVKFSSIYVSYIYIYIYSHYTLEDYLQFIDKALNGTNCFVVRVLAIKAVEKQFSMQELSINNNLRVI